MRDENPFAAPDDERLAAAPSRGPDPEDVEAHYEGSGQGAERWALSVTPAKLYFSQAQTDISLALGREEVAEQLHLGTVAKRDVMLMLRGPERRGFRMPRAAIDHVYRWLGTEMQDALRVRLMRNGWGSTLAVGLIFLVPMDLPAVANGMGMVAGAVLVAAALVSRFSGHHVGFLLRALGWGLLALQMLYGVVIEARSPWMVAVGALLLWGVLRYVRLYGLLTPPDAAAEPQGV